VTYRGSGVISAWCLLSLVSVCVSRFGFADVRMKTEWDGGATRQVALFQPWARRVVAVCGFVVVGRAAVGVAGVGFFVGYYARSPSGGLAVSVGAVALGLFGGGGFEGGDPFFFICRLRRGRWCSWWVAGAAFLCGVLMPRPFFIFRLAIRFFS